jgi:hypothetical protein
MYYVYKIEGPQIGICGTPDFKEQKWEQKVQELGMEAVCQFRNE